MVPAGGPPSLLQPPPTLPQPGELALRPEPPAPPKEEDSAFVRRVRLVYLDRVTREHQRLDLLDSTDTGKPIPNAVLTLGALIPYMAAASYIVVAVFIIFMYGTKFSEMTERLWLLATIIGLVTVT